MDVVHDYPGEPIPEPIWILLKQDTVSGSVISWTICKCAPRCRQMTMPAPHHSIFTGRMPFLPPNQQRQSTELVFSGYRNVQITCHVLNGTSPPTALLHNTSTRQSNFKSVRYFKRHWRCV